MQNRCRQEIIGLHQFFQDWFTGQLQPTEATFGRVSTVLNDNFVLISPDGNLTEKEPLIRRLYQSHGTRVNWRIWIEAFRLRHQAGDLALATYEEWQETDRGQTVRLSTVLFGRQPGTPHGLEWLHVHETWLPRDPA